jgi:hypothetical protein
MVFFWMYFSYLNMYKDIINHFDTLTSDVVTLMCHVNWSRLGLVLWHQVSCNSLTGWHPGQIAQNDRLKLSLSTVEGLVPWTNLSHFGRLHSKSNKFVRPHHKHEYHIDIIFLSSYKWFVLVKVIKSCLEMLPVSQSLGLVNIYKAFWLFRI